MNRADVLEQAKTIVNGERDEEYGVPENNFGRIARLWSTYLDEPDRIGPEDVAIMMMLLKVARLRSSFYESMDSWVDIAGYAACGAEIASRSYKMPTKREDSEEKA